MGAHQRTRHYSDAPLLSRNLEPKGSLTANSLQISGKEEGGTGNRLTNANVRSILVGMAASEARRAIPDALVNRIRPVAAAAQRSLPVLDALTSLFPNGLPRGITMTTSGPAARSCAFGMLAAATQAGSWLAVLGLEDPGWRAAAELGVPTARIVVVDTGRSGGPSGGRGDRRASGRDAEFIAAALDGFDLVLVGPQVRLNTATEQRLGARARERGALLVGVHENAAGALGTATGDQHRTIGPFAQTADLRVTTQSDHWEGIDAGHGHLTARQVGVVAEGKRLPGRRRTAQLWLPGPDGSVTPVAQPTATTGRRPIVSSSAAGSRLPTRRIERVERSA